MSTSITRKLRLLPLAKTESIKLIFSCPASSKVDLDRYAAMHAQTYGEAVDATTVIPHMLEAFIAVEQGNDVRLPSRAAMPKGDGKFEFIIVIVA